MSLHKDSPQFLRRAQEETPLQIHPEETSLIDSVVYQGTIEAERAEFFNQQRYAESNSQHMHVINRSGSTINDRSEDRSAGKWFNFIGNIYNLILMESTLSKAVHGDSDHFKDDYTVE